MSTTPACPTPQKKRYATREAAEGAARGVQIAIPDPLHPYICICTWWHLSKTPTQLIPDDAQADPADVERLTLMSLTTFRDLVVNEARGKTPLHDRIALRWCTRDKQPLLCVRCWDAEALLEENDSSINRDAETMRQICEANARADAKRQNRAEKARA